MPFSDGFSAFVEGYNRSADAAANRKRMEAADARTEQMFALQMDEANARKREREEQEAARKLESDARAELHKPANEPAVPVAAPDAAPAIVADDGVASGGVPGSANDGSAGEAAAQRRAGRVDFSAIDKALQSGVTPPGQIFQGGLSRFAQDMRLADKLRASGNRYAVENADRIVATARRARSEGVMEAFDALSAGDMEGALQHFQGSGAMRLPAGAKLVDRGEVRDTYTGAPRKRYALVDKDNAELVGDAQQAMLQYVFTPKERVALEAARTSKDGAMAMKEAQLAMQEKLIDWKMLHGVGARGQGGAGQGGATEKDQATIDSTIHKHMSERYGADKEAPAQERATSAQQVTQKTAEASAIWQLNQAAGRTIPASTAIYALDLAQDRKNLGIATLSNGQKALVVNAGGRSVIVGMAPSGGGEGKPAAEPAASPAAPAARAADTKSPGRAPTYQEQEFRAAIGKQGWAPVGSMKGLFSDTPLYGKRDAEGNMVYKNRDELATLLDIEY